MAKYGKKTQDLVEETLHREKKGTLKSGSGKKVKSRKQALAIALSEAKEKGYKVPKKKSAKKSASKKSSSKKTTSTKKAAKKSSTSKKSAAKKRSSSKNK